MQHTRLFFTAVQLQPNGQSVGDEHRPMVIGKNYVLLTF